MQIKRGVDHGAPTPKLALEPPFDWREWRRGSRRLA
jgi:hypothetical protein